MAYCAQLGLVVSRPPFSLKWHGHARGYILTNDVVCITSYVFTTERMGLCLQSSGQPAAASTTHPERKNARLATYQGYEGTPIR
jgi:hypothetical protein